MYICKYLVFVVRGSQDERSDWNRMFGSLKSLFLSTVEKKRIRRPKIFLSSQSRHVGFLIALTFLANCCKRSLACGPQRRPAKMYIQFMIEETTRLSFYCLFDNYRPFFFLFSLRCLKDVHQHNPVIVIYSLWNTSRVKKACR